MSDSNILLKIKDTKVTLKIDDDNNFELLVGGKGKFKLLSESDGYQEGRLDELDSIYDKYKELSREGPSIRLGFSHKSGELNTNFAGKVSNVGKISEGKYLIKGSIYDDILDKPGKFERYEIIGSKFAQKHNNFEPFEGEIDIDDDHSSIFLDTFSRKELNDHDIQSFIDQSIALGDNDFSKSFRLVDESNGRHSFVDGASKRFSFKLVEVDETLTSENHSGSLNIKGIVEPFVDARLNTPESWWSYLNPSKYSVDFDLGTSWEAGIIADPGGETGNINFGSNDFEGPELTKSGLISARLGTGVGAEGKLLIRGATQPFELSASQKYEFNYKLSTNGVEKSDNSDQEVATKFTGFDEVTGLGLEATVEPYIDLEVGVFSPDLPIIGRQNLASVEGKLSVPVIFKVGYNLDYGFDANLAISGKYEATAKALQILGSSGIEQKIAEGTLFEWESGNILA